MKGLYAERREGAMRDHEIIELYWARNESAIAATAEKYGSYCHTIAYNILVGYRVAFSLQFIFMG